MSNKFESINIIDVYETDGVENPTVEMPTMKIKNHWNLRDFVVLEIDGKSHTVLARELRKAIENAQNAHCI